MFQLNLPRTLAAIAVFAALSTWSASAQQVKTVFVIAMENHNWTQPDSTGNPQQIFQNPNAPFINSLVSGASAFSSQVSYATAYHNALATASGVNPHIHPSEPNYIWSEAGNNLSVLNDNDPFAATKPSNQKTKQHLTGFLTAAGKTWKSYQEDTDLTLAGGGLTNTPLSPDQYTVPLSSFSGNFVSGTNQYNGSTQYNYACKHNPQVFFTDTNGGDNPTTSNPLSANYAPLQQLITDLANNTVADYNWITPDQYNDMHTALNGGFEGKTGDAANIAQGDNFLSIVVPQIMASQAYKNNGVIVIWWDESESDGPADVNPDDFTHTLGEIIISPLAHPNVNGMPYASAVNYDHSSDLRTWEEVFGLSPFLRHANTTNGIPANDLSDLFAAGAIPSQP